MQNNEPWASEGEYPINGFVRFLMFWNVILVFMTPMLYERSSRSQAAKNRRTGDDLSSRRLKCEQQTEFLEWELLKLFHCSYLKTYSSPNLFKWVDLGIDTILMVKISTHSPFRPLLMYVNGHRQKSKLFLTMNTTWTSPLLIVILMIFESFVSHDLSNSSAHTDIFTYLGKLIIW